VFGDDVYGALFCFGEVCEGVFGAVEAACEANYEEWGVVVYEVEVGEGGEVC
jgi:hypothetical protein